MEMECTLAALIATLLIGFGVAYNALVTWLEREEHDRGYMSLIVSFGVAVTVAAAGPLIGWHDVLIVLALFAASGAPMILGSISRYAKERREEQALNHEIVEEMFDNGNSA